MATPIIIIFNRTIMSIRMLVHCFSYRIRNSHNCYDEYDGYNTILIQSIFNSINLICHERTNMLMTINKCLYTRA